MLGILSSRLVELKHLLEWHFKHRRAGVPIEYHSNMDYLDWHYHYRPALMRYKNIHEGQDCFIIGNGPSLNRMNLSLLNEYYLFGLNKIHLIFEKHKLNLSYHAIANPLVIEQMTHELESDVFGCPSFLTYRSSKQYQYSNSRIHRLFTDNRWSFYHTIEKPISEGYTVTYVAMQLAFYMGFKNVFLVGVDHNFKQSGKANEKQHHEGDDVNHFHPDYFKGMNWHLADLEGNEASYAMAKHQYHEAGREIYDGTVDGKLTIFRKISFEQALLMARKKNL